MFTLGRIQLDSPITFTEQVGDPVTNTGGAPVPAVRSAIRHSVDLPTFTAPINTDTVERRMRARRQIRSVLNNAAYKMAGIYLNWEEDSEQNGWYILDQGQIVAGADSPLTHGWFDLQNFNWYKLGASRTHRQALAVTMKDLRTGLQARDILRTVYSTDYATITPLALTYLPAGSSDIANSVTSEYALNPTSAGQLANGPAVLPAGRDGGANKLVVGQADAVVLGFELPDASRNLGDVVIYDKRGLGLPTKGEDPQAHGWEEIYGADYQYSGTTPPVLDNGLVRVVYDATHADGFIIYVWNGTEYLEQGKMLFQDNTNFFAGFVTEFLSATVKEYTPERAVLQVNVRSGGVGFSAPGGRARIFITLQRGWSGPRIEYYPAAGPTEGVVKPIMYWSQPVIGENTSAIKQDTTAPAGVAVIDATAGSGSTSFATAALGAATFTGQNVIAILRQGGTFQQMLAFVQSGVTAKVLSNSEAFGTAVNTIELTTPAATGYMSVRLAFTAQMAEQMLEAESMTLATGTTSTVDAAASNGKAATATRIADALHVSRATWPNNDTGTYRVFARVKTSASKINIYAKTALTTGATLQSASTTYVWVDLGDVAVEEGTLEIHAWATAAATISVDRIEAFLSEDHEVESHGTYSGYRDVGRAALYDSRTQPTVVTKT